MVAVAVAAVTVSVAAAAGTYWVVLLRVGCPSRPWIPFPFGVIVFFSRCSLIKLAVSLRPQFRWSPMWCPFVQELTPTGVWVDYSQDVIKIVEELDLFLSWPQ